MSCDAMLTRLVTGGVMLIRIGARSMGLVARSGSVVLVCACLAATSCGRSDSPSPIGPVAVASVSVEPSNASIVVGQSRQLIAMPKGASGAALAGRSVVWTSSDTTKARVSSAGLVTGVTVGSVIITATSEAKAGTATITVQLATQTVSVQVNTAELPGASNVMTMYGVTAISAAGAAAPTITANAAQLVMATDPNNQLRGLALTNDGSAVTTALDATSTAVSLVLLTPEIMTADGIVLADRIRLIRELPCIPGLAQALKTALATHGLEVATASSAVAATRESCTSGALAAIRASAGFLANESANVVVGEGSSSGFSVRVVDEGLSSHFELENKTFTRVDVYSRDIHGGTGPLSPRRVIQSMKGQVPLSWGSTITWSAFQPTVFNDLAPYTSAAPTMEYWFLSGGLRSALVSPPPGMQVRSGVLWSWSAWDYGVGPVLGFLANHKSLEPYVEAALVGVDVTKVLIATDQDAANRATIDAVVGIASGVAAGYCASFVVGNVTAPAGCTVLEIQKTISSLMRIANFSVWTYHMFSTPSAVSISLANRIGPRDLVLVSGGAQTAVAGSSLSPISILVRNSLLKAVKGVRVSFTVTAGGGSLTSSSAVSDDNGLVQAQWRLGSATGTQTITASIDGSDSEPLRVDAAATGGTTSATAAQTTLALSASSVSVGGMLTVTVTVRNGSGQVLTSTTPSAILATASSGMLGSFTCTAGVCTATYTAPATAATVTIGVTIDGAAVSGSPASVTVAQSPVATVPATPTNLVSGAVSSTQIDLSWTDNANNEDGFDVEQCTGATCTGFAKVASTAANVTDAPISGLAASTTYRFRVRAKNAAGFSGYAAILTATTLPPPVTLPTAPTGLYAWVVSDDLIHLRWTDNANNEDGFDVEQCTGATCTSFVKVASTAANVTDAPISGLAASTTYRFRVRAKNAAGFSGYSTILTATTLAPTATRLAGPTAVVNISGSQGLMKYYVIAVPAGRARLEVALGPGGGAFSGNPDLFVRRSSLPTTTTNDCSSTRTSTNADYCSMSNPSAGDWYIAVRGTTSYSGWQLVVSY